MNARKTDRRPERRARPLYPDREFLSCMAPPGERATRDRALFVFQKLAAQRTRRAEAAREFLMDMVPRPARACAALEEHAPGICK